MLVLLAPLLVPVNASSVTSLPSVRYVTKFGSLTPLNQISFNSLTLFANGTTFLNVTGFELSEPDRQLRFTQISNGTGTWQIRVATSLVPNVLGILSSQSYSNGLLKIDAAYNDAVVRTGVLVIAWGGIATQARNGAYFLGLLLLPFLVLAVAFWLNRNSFRQETGGGHFGSHGDGGQNILVIAIIILALTLIGALVAIGFYGGI